jgi:hypothetical protein
MEHYFQQIRDEFDAADQAHKDSFWRFQTVKESHSKGNISSDEYILALSIHNLTVKRCDAIWELMQKYEIKTNAELAEERGAMEHAAWYDTSAELI